MLKPTLKLLRSQNPALRIEAMELPDHIWVYNFGVKNGFRNQGIGTRAILELQKLGKPLRLMMLEEDGCEEALLRFYTRLGFKLLKPASDDILEWKP